jgi:hypothetical protein
VTISPGGAPTPPSSGAWGPQPHARPSTISRGGVPTDEEMVAILAAIEMSWPRAVVVESARPESGGWRFSGRWWSKPHTVQRVRPWVERS